MYGRGGRRERGSKGERETETKQDIVLGGSSEKSEERVEEYNGVLVSDGTLRLNLHRSVRRHLRGQRR